MFVAVVDAALAGHVLSVIDEPVMLAGVYGTSDISVCETGVTATAVGYCVLTGAR